MNIKPRFGSEYLRSSKYFSRWAVSLCLWLGLTAHAAEEPHPLLRDFIGINGHTVQFKPELYRPVCGLVRDYHPVDWDLGKRPAELPSFPFAQNRVDWNQVYGSWRQHHWGIDVCLIFESIPRATWKDIAAEARAYGQAVAREFGPSGQRRLMDSVEIGNEPGQWSDADYTEMFTALAGGIRAGDPKLKIVTCNLTVGKSDRYSKSVQCMAQHPELIDALNIHSYAQLEGWPTWRRSFPEDPRLTHYLQDIIEFCQWRDTQLPGKPVWLTEFGYDSSTQLAEKSGEFTHWVGVTDLQQAQWLVRSLLVFSAMPLERAYIYFFNDTDQPRLHASAGITRNFQPKPSYHALAHLQHLLGDYRFQRVVTNEPARIRVQEYRNNGNRIIWAVWSPTGAGQEITATLDHLPGRLDEIQRMPTSANSVDVPVLPPLIDGQINLPVNESPQYLVFTLPAAAASKP